MLFIIVFQVSDHHWNNYVLTKDWFKRLVQISSKPSVSINQALVRYFLQCCHFVRRRNHPVPKWRPKTTWVFPSVQSQRGLGLGPFTWLQRRGGEGLRSRGRGLGGEVRLYADARTLAGTATRVCFFCVRVCVRSVSRTAVGCLVHVTCQYSPPSPPPTPSPSLSPLPSPTKAPRELPTAAGVHDETFDQRSFHNDFKFSVFMSKSPTVLSYGLLLHKTLFRDYYLFSCRKVLCLMKYELALMIKLIIATIEILI